MSDKNVYESVRDDAAGCIGFIIFCIIALAVIAIASIVAILTALFYLGIALIVSGVVLFLLAIPIHLAFKARLAQDRFSENINMLSELKKVSYRACNLLEKRRIEGEKLKENQLLNSSDISIINNSFKDIENEYEESLSEYNIKAHEIMNEIEDDLVIVDYFKKKAIKNIANISHRIIESEIERLAKIEVFVLKRKAQVADEFPIQYSAFNEDNSPNHIQNSYYKKVRFAHLAVLSNVTLSREEKQILSFSKFAVFIGFTEITILSILSAILTLIITYDQFGNSTEDGFGALFCCGLIIFLAVGALVYFVEDVLT